MCVVCEEWVPLLEGEHSRCKWLRYVENPLIGYLNIVTIRNKFIVFREIMQDLSPEYLLLISGTNWV